MSWDHSSSSEHQQSIILWILSSNGARICSQTINTLWLNPLSPSTTLFSFRICKTFLATSTSLQPWVVSKAFQNAVGSSFQSSDSHVGSEKPAPVVLFADKKALGRMTETWQELPYWNATVRELLFWGGEEGVITVNCYCGVKDTRRKEHFSTRSVTLDKLLLITCSFSLSNYYTTRY